MQKQLLFTDVHCFREFPKSQAQKGLLLLVRVVILKQRHDDQRVSGHGGERKHTHCFLSFLNAGLLGTFDMVQMLRGVSLCPRTASTFEVGTQLSVHPWVPLPPLNIVGTWLAPWPLQVPGNDH